MLESPVTPVAPPGHASSGLPPPPPTYSIKEALKLLSPPPARLLPSFRRCGNPSRGDGQPCAPAIDSRRRPAQGRVSSVDSRGPAPPPRPIDRLPLLPIDLSRPAAPRSGPPARADDPGSPVVSAIKSRRRTPPPRSGAGALPLPLPAISKRQTAARPQPSVHVHDPESPAPPPRSSIRVDDPGRVRNINSPAPRPRTSIRVDDPGRVRAANSRHTASRPPSVSSSCKASPAANKELEEAENEIQRLNELRLGDDISYEEHMGHMKQLPEKPDVDTSAKLDAIQLKELNTRHALYRIKYYQLSQQVPKDDLCYDKLKEDCPPGLLENERFFKSYEDGKLDWCFHPDYCKLAGLEDYQRLVPQNYGGYEYVRWDEYPKDFHCYETEQEYIKYCEELSKKLKWMEAYVPNKPPSLKRGRILTRGTYQAIKIATEFSKITGRLAFSGFCEWLESMSFDVCHYNEFDGVYYEIWQRCTNETKFRDVLDDVYQLNRFPLRQDRMRCALENDTFCSDFEEEFLACTACLKEFTEDKAQVTEEKARELIAEALRKETQKPKFYEDYCRKKIDVARAIGLISR